MIHRIITAGLFVLCVAGEVFRPFPIDRAVELAEKALSDSVSLSAAYHASEILSQLNRKLECDCKQLNKATKGSTSSLQAFYGIRAMEQCGCSQIPGEKSLGALADSSAEV